MTSGDLDICLLGGVEARVGGRLCDLGGPRQRAVFACLVVAAPEAVAAGELIERVWADQVPPSALNTLQSYVSRLRRAVGADHIVGLAGRYRLAHGEGLQVDLHVFQQCIAEARAALAADAPEEALARCEEASAQWRGEPFQEFDAVWATIERARLLELRELALEVEAEAALETGDAPRAAALADGIVRASPSRERGWSLLMRSLYAQGRQADALDAYARARQRLVDDLGIEPSEALRDTHRRVLRQDATLDRPGRTRRVMNAPAPPTPLVGRRDDVAAIADVIAHGRARLVTITGVGGVGKTRVSLAVAAELDDRFADGVGWVPLAAMDDAAAVTPAITSVLGLDGYDRRQAVDVGHWLRRRRMLLVLDNLEQIRDVGAVIAALLAAAPKLCVLATSRHAVRVGGEFEHRLDPLPLDDAIELFQQRALAATARACGHDSAASICTLSDCLPLAIELTASSLRHCSPTTLEARLRGRHPIGERAGEDAPPRHQTVDAAISWSHDLLGSDEQAVFARLSLFPGRCTFDAAEAICDATVETIAAVVDSGLLRHECDAYMMFETVRRFASGRLEAAGEDARTLQRLVAWFARLAERSHRAISTGVDARDWYARLDANQDGLAFATATATTSGDVDSALRLAALWPYHRVRGRSSEARTMLVDVLALVDADDPRALRAVEGLIELSLDLDDIASASGYVPRLVGLGPAGRLSALFYDGLVASAAGAPGARRMLRDAVAVAVGIGDEVTACSARSLLANEAFDTGDYEQALALANEDLKTELGRTTSFACARSLDMRAMSLTQLGRPTSARAAFIEAHAVQARITIAPMRLATSWLLSGLAGTFVHDDARLAARLLGRSDSIADDVEIVLEASEVDFRRATRASVQGEIGDEAFAREYAIGASTPEHELTAAAAHDPTTALPAVAPALPP